jgi:8-oxo-dGTP diphosphatase
MSYIPYAEYSTIKEHEGTDVGDTPEGTWGKSGAGMLIFDRKKRQVLLFKRADNVYDPGLWGITGGARRVLHGEEEDPLVCAVTETREEAGSLPQGRIWSIPYVFRKASFSYFTFVLEIEGPFTPVLNWEHTDARWFDLDAAADDLAVHPGVRDMLKNFEFLHQ